MSHVIANRRFDRALQVRFAAASGDVNPVHVDPLAARRTQAGSVVVHGVHALLWSLDELISSGHAAQPVAGLDARFDKFIYLDSEVTLRLSRRDASGLRAELVANGSVTTTVDLRFGALGPEATRPHLDALPIPKEPVVLDFDDVAARSGRLVAQRDHLLAEMFPSAALRLGIARIETIARLSAIVGMVCPGLHSIFGALSLTFVASNDARGTGFRVDRVDERFRLVRMAVDGSGVEGSVTAFMRQPPVLQPSLRDLAARVVPDEFAGMKALIVGGSRGLGALTARAIAAGGGRVTVTYLVGESEARAIQAEIGPQHCSIIRYDAREEPAPQLAPLADPVHQLYYFATAQIVRPKAGWFIAERFTEFARMYLDGFEAICRTLAARSSPLTAFYPSSVAVEEHPRDMTEYSMAKAAGEILCADMNRFSAGIRVVVERLPRVLTDQTASVIPIENSDAAGVMLPIIRRMHATARSAMTPG